MMRLVLLAAAHVGSRRLRLVAGHAGVRCVTMGVPQPGPPPRSLPPLPDFALQTLLVLDVEATCDQPQRLPHEIIEWPVVAVDAATAQPIAEFHR